MHKFPVYHVDAFAEKPFQGNPAAVMPLKEWLPDELLQQIAMENNLSETAYFVPLSPERMKTTGADYHIRWFTPNTEVELCGHATLASAMVIDKVLHLDTKKHRITFLTDKAGLLVVYASNGWYTLDLPSRMPQPCETPEGLFKALGIKSAVEVLRSRDYFVVLENEAAIRALKPDFSLLKSIEGFGIIVTAPGDVADAVSRCFFPNAGVDEDPVTGSAHCNIIPFWSHKLAKDELECRQLSARGGTLVCQQKGERVWMSGKCTLFMEGTIHL